MLHGIHPLGDNVGYINYQALNGGQPIQSKTKMRKKLRLQGRGKGGCEAARHSSFPSYAPAIEFQSAKPTGKIDPHDSYIAICHKGHRHDYYPERIRANTEVLCKACHEIFVAKA